LMDRQHKGEKKKDKKMYYVPIMYWP
jgi:hypothetical protein